MGCFVKEANIDNDFKMALYPRWVEGAAVQTREICKTKEYYARIKSDPRLREQVEKNPLELLKLHHDLAQATDRHNEQAKENARAYAETVQQLFITMANRLGRGLEERIKGPIQRYVDDAEKKRNSIFEDFNKNLIDGLLWENTTRTNRVVEQAQPSAGNEPTQQSDQPTVPIAWEDYKDHAFKSNESALLQLRQKGPDPGNMEEDDQVRSVN